MSAMLSVWLPSTLGGISVKAYELDRIVADRADGKVGHSGPALPLIFFVLPGCRLIARAESRPNA